MRTSSARKRYGHGTKKLGFGNGFKSSLERGFAAYLEELMLGGEIIWWKYEAVRFILGSATTYCPDFMVQLKDGEIVFYEVKGRPREDSWIKLKLAASHFPFRFFLVTKGRHSWEFKEVASGQERDGEGV